MQLTINRKKFEAREGETILEICLRNKVEIPHLCWHPDLKHEARCRLCIVSVDGKIMTSCNTKVKEGMIVQTENKKINIYRKLVLEFLTAHNKELLDELHALDRVIKKKVGLKKEHIRFEKREKILDDLSSALIRDDSRCVLCGKCVQECRDIQKVNILRFTKRSHLSEVCPEFDKSFRDVACTFCGQCAVVCPTGAIREKSSLNEVKAAIKNPKKVVVVQTAPAIRASVGETQGMLAGTIITGKLVSALRRLGFDRVLDTNFGADITIVEEGAEFVKRLKNKEKLPMITSCCPGWVKYVEHFFPELINNLSTAKSPHQMFGSAVKSYYAKKNKIAPKDLVCVSIMPCTAKKFEIERPELKVKGVRDVDYVLTARELGNWLKEESINLKTLPNEPYDPLMGTSSGGGAIFGVTGGVVESALRYVADALEKKDLKKVEYKEVRGLEGVRKATVKINGKRLNIAIANGLGNAHKLLEDVKHNKSRYHFIEIMACPGGCIGGGGQPIPTTKEIIKKRAAALYKIDASLPVRKPQDNPEIIQMYREFFGAHGSKKAYKYLHTRYRKRGRFGN